VVSTFDDLQLWAGALFTGEGILDPASQQLRRDSIVYGLPPLTATSGYGIGIVDRDGWWGHDGEIPGYTTSVQHNYENDTRSSWWSTATSGSLRTPSRSHRRRPCRPN